MQNPTCLFRSTRLFGIAEQGYLGNLGPKNHLGITNYIVTYIDIHVSNILKNHNLIQVISKIRIFPKIYVIHTLCTYIVLTNTFCHIWDIFKTYQILFLEKNFIPVKSSHSRFVCLGSKSLALIPAYNSCHSIPEIKAQT